MENKKNNNRPLYKQTIDFALIVFLVNYLLLVLTMREEHNSERIHWTSTGLLIVFAVRLLRDSMREAGRLFYNGSTPLSAFLGREKKQHKELKYLKPDELRVKFDEAMELEEYEICKEITDLLKKGGEEISRNNDVIS